MSVVLVLTEECDPTADAIIDELQQRGVEIYRADLGWFPRDLELDAVLDTEGWSGRLHGPHRNLCLNDVQSVLYRRPTGFTIPPGMSRAEMRHAQMEAKIGLGGILWSLPGVLWVNHPARAADMYKPLQLATAARMGLLTPRTLVTNQAKAVRRFAEEVDGPIGVKPLGYASIVEGRRRALYTHPLTDDDLADLRGVEHTAHLFQQYIADKRYELRLTVVGEQMFAAGVYAGSPAARVDFRADAKALSYRTVEVPGHVAAGVRAFMRHFHIIYGAFDFCVDSEGRHWFLECNPAGEYLFIEHPTGLRISAALADLLQKGTQ